MDAPLGEDLWVENQPGSVRLNRAARLPWQYRILFSGGCVACVVGLQCACAARHAPRHELSLWYDVSHAEKSDLQLSAVVYTLHIVLVVVRRLLLRDSD